MNYIRSFFILLILLISGKTFSQCTSIIGSNITPIAGCEILTIQFNDLSTGPVQTRLWDFGDGSPTTGTQTPVHSFTSGFSGDTNYVVRLTIQCVSGPPSSAFDTVHVYKKPKMLFSSNKVNLCALSDSVCFINLSTNGIGYTYLWNFGDFTTSTKFQPCHTYTTGGSYNVQLTVTNAHGCANSITFNNYITVIPAPNIDFNISSFLGCSPLAASFTNLTDTVTNQVTAWQWNLGDGSPILNTYAPGSHTYIQPNTYYITLVAANSLGCSNRTTKAVVVHTTPVSTFTVVSPVCANANSLITYTGAAVPSANYTWNFSGGTAIPGTGQGPHSTYWTTSGNKTISLTVTDTGCSSSTTKQVLVNPVSAVQLAVSPNSVVCDNQSVTFTATPSTMASYLFYHNNVLVQNSTSNLYTSSNFNTGDSVYVIANNAFGCPTPKSNGITLTIKALPVATLSSNLLSVCAGGNLIFTASPSTYPSYSFFKGFQLLQNSSSNVFSSTSWVNGDSIYVVPTNTGCVGSPSNSIHPTVLQPLPSPQVNCGITTDNTIEFTWNSVSGATGYIVSVNGGAFETPSSGNLGTTHLITGVTPGSNATIIVTALGDPPCGNSQPSVLHTCTATNCAGIAFTFNQNSTICIGDTITLTLSGFTIANPYVSWTGGTPQANNNSITLSPTQDTIVTVAVNVAPPTACVPVTNFLNIHVNQKPVVTLSTVPVTDTICQGNSLAFVANPTGFDSYDFYNGQALIQSSNSPFYTASNLANGNSISVVATDNGCIGTASGSVSTIINQPLPTPQVNCGTTTTSSIQFTWNAIVGATGYIVSVNGGAFITPSSGNNGTSHLITGLTGGTSANIVVVALGNQPCGNSLPSTLQICNAINCSPITFNFNPNQTICNGDPVTLTLSGFNIANPFVSWNGGASLANNNSFTTSPGASTNINFSVSDPSQTGCSSVNNFFAISVNPKPVVTLSIDPSADTTCQGTSIAFSVSPIPGLTTYSFYDGFFLLQSSSNNFYTAANWISGDSLFVKATNNGCTSNPSNAIFPKVFQPLPSPQVNCGTTTDNSIEFTWNSVPGATGYLVDVNGAGNITPSSGNLGTTHLITGLTPGSSSTIIVTALGALPCGNSLPSVIHTCVATNCTGIVFNFNQNSTICKGDPITLTLSGFNIANPYVSWTGSIPQANNNSITLSPTQDTIVTVTVNIAPPTACTPVTNFLNIHVNQKPVVTLSTVPPTDTICQGNTVNFAAAPTGFDGYNFYNGQALIQSSNSPFLNTNNLTNGNSITVVATDNGCFGAASSSISTIVNQPLPTPQVNCGITTSTSIQFTWNAISGATGYKVSVNGGPLITPSSGNNGTTHLINGLTSGTSANIVVVALGSQPCGNSLPSALHTCNAINCTPVTFNFNPNQSICNGDPVTLTLSGFNIANPYVSWNGGASLPNNNSFTIAPTADTILNISVRDTSQANCGSVDNSFVINVNSKPLVTLSIGSSMDTTCQGTPILFTASPTVGLTTYSFFNGFAPLQNTLNNSYTANNWVDGDSLFVTATNNGCTSNPSNAVFPTVMPPLPAPQANCGTTTTSSIEFTWNSVSGATGYLVSVNGGAFIPPSSGNSGTTHLITGLTNGSSVTIVVKALGLLPCGNSLPSALHTCFAINCPAITFNFTPAQTICSGDAVTLSLSGYNISNPYVSWNGGSSISNNNSFTFSPTHDTVINFSVNRPPPTSCVPVTNFFNIHVNPKPVVTISEVPVIDTICQGTLLSFAASPTSNDVFDFYNGTTILQSSNSPYFSTSNLPVGNSIHVVATNNGCISNPSNAVSTIVNQPLPAPQPNCGTTTDSTIQFTWNPIAGAIGYILSINGGAFVTPSSGNNGTTHLITGLNQGDSANIVVVALGNLPCGNSLPSAIHTCYAMNCSAITYNFNPYQTVCEGDSITLTISGFNIANPNVSWNGGPYLSNNNTITVTPTTSTNVNFAVTDALQSSCVPMVNFFALQVNPAPVVALSVSPASDNVCLGSSLVFTASPLGNANYTFYQGFLPLQSSPSPVYSTTNWVNGDSIHVVASNLSCAGGPSNYLVPIMVQPLPAPQANCGTSTNSTIQFTWNAIAGAAGYIVSVNGGSFITPSSGNMGTSHLISGLTAGDSANIVVIALGALPCGNSAPSALHTCFATNCSAITFSYTPYQTICNGDALTLSLSGFNPANPLVSWNGGAFSSGNNSFTISPSSDTIIHFSVKDPLQSTCVPVSNYFDIQVNPIPVFTFSVSPSNDTICQNVPATFSASPAGFSDYSFYNGITLLQSSNNPDFIAPNSTAGTISLHVVSSYQGCQYTGTTLPLTILPSPTLTLAASPSGSTVCYGDTVVFTASPATYSTYTFYNGNTIIQSSSSNTLVLFNMSIGNGNAVSVIATNAYGCNSNISNVLNFNVPLPPTVSLACSDPDLVICQNEAVTYTASPSGMASYQFYNGTTLVQNSGNATYTTTGLQTGNSVYVVGTNAAGCKSFNSSSLTLVVNPSPPSYISSTDTTICAGTSVTLTANQNPVVTGSTFLWNTGSPNLTISVSPATTTTYSLTANLNGCNGIPSTLTILVDVAPPSAPDAGVSGTICIHDSMSLAGSGGTYYFWTPTFGLSNPNISNPKASPDSTTTYTLHTSNLYCYSIDSITVIIDLCLTDIPIPIPNAITPNGDGSNDNFEIPYLWYFKKNSIKIYNRWGNPVFNESPYLNDWSGKSSDGKLLPDGIYYYVLDLGNGNKPQAGYVLINR